MVIWLLGISGAGKSTLGKEVKKYFVDKKLPVYLIDGDEIRAFFENDLGYSIEERKANIKRIIYASYVLNENGINVIVCNISPFEELRQFARRKIKNYMQIYLLKDIQRSTYHDVKNVYSMHSGKTELVGIDIVFDEPTSNELVIETDHFTIEESLNMIYKLLSDKGI